MIIYFRNILGQLDIREEDKKFLYKWLFIGLVLHLITAYFSKGFYHFDEHFQIFEFMNAKLGKTPISALPWEYEFKMRSFTQPGLYYLITKALNFLSIENPFTIATIIRFFSTMLGWLSVITMSLMTFVLIDKKQLRYWAIRLLNIAYFIPFIHARPSSEAFASTFLILGISFFIIDSHLEKKSASFPAWLSLCFGIILGLSFTFRYQIGFSILFFWIWYLIWGSKNYTKIILVAIGVLIAVGIEILCDRWGYGEWTIAAWNYLNQNLVQDKASNFPTGPWYFFIRKMISRCVMPIGLLVLVSWFALWIKKWKHPISFTTFPFVLVHTIIANKAFRYLFPIAPLSPIVMVQAYSIFPDKWMKKLTWLFKLTLLVNCIILPLVLFRSAKSVTSIYEHVYDKKIKKIHYVGENPYTMVGLPLYYYKKADLKLNQVANHNELALTNGMVFLRKGKRIMEYLERKNCSLKYSSYPIFSLKFNYFKWVERSRFWALFECKDFTTKGHKGL